MRASRLWPGGLQAHLGGLCAAACSMRSARVCARSRQTRARTHKIPAIKPCANCLLEDTLGNQVPTAVSACALQLEAPLIAARKASVVSMARCQPARSELMLEAPLIAAHQWRRASLCTFGVVQQMACLHAFLTGRPFSSTDLSLGAGGTLPTQALMFFPPTFTVHVPLRGGCGDGGVGVGDAVRATHGARRLTNRPSCSSWGP